MFGLWMFCFVSFFGFDFVMRCVFGSFIDFGVC